MAEPASPSPAVPDDAAVTPPAPGFLHVAGTSISGSVTTALIGAAIAGAVAFVAGISPTASSSITGFLGTMHLNLSQTFGGVLNNSAYLNLGASAASLGGIVGAALGGLSGAISGVGHIRKHYQENVVPPAEQKALQVGMEIGARQKEQQILEALQAAAHEHEEQAASLLNFRSKVDKRDPKFVLQADKDKQLAAQPQMG